MDEVFPASVYENRELESSVKVGSACQCVWFGMDAGTSGSCWAMFSDTSYEALGGRPVWRASESRPRLCGGKG